MTAKRVAIGGRPVAEANAERWVRRGEDAGGADGAGNPAPTLRVEVYTARLTIDVTPALRGRIKVAAFRQGLTVAELMRTLFEREFPDGDGNA